MTIRDLERRISKLEESSMVLDGKTVAGIRSVIHVIPPNEDRRSYRTGYLIFSDGTEKEVETPEEKQIFDAIEEQSKGPVKIRVRIVD